MRARKKLSLMIALVAAAFGGFYAVVADVASLLPGVSRMASPWQIVLRLGLAALVALTLFIAVQVLSILKGRAARQVGFIAMEKNWFSRSVDERINKGRKVLTELVSDGAWPLRLASVTGEWDMCRPYSEKELRATFKAADSAAQVLLIHPDSDALAERCALEASDLVTMKRRIVHSTNYLMAAGQGRVRVRWYLEPPFFHLFGNSRVMHFSPFVSGIQGHDTPRYVVDSASPVFRSYSAWFEWTWDHALPAEHELHWVERSVMPRRAVFFDRDNTLIKDVAYFAAAETTKIEILPGVIDGLRLFQHAGYRLIVVSNQHPVAMRITDSQELVNLTKKIKQCFAGEGVIFDAFYYCTHSETDGCNCRKPRAQLFQRAAKDFSLDLRECHFIGDSEADRAVKGNLPELDVRIVGARSFLDLARSITAAESGRD